MIKVEEITSYLRRTLKKWNIFIETCLRKEILENLNLEIIVEAQLPLKS